MISSGIIKAKETHCMEIAFTDQEIAKMVQMLGEKILDQHRSTDDLAFLGIQTGGVPLAKRLQKILQPHFQRLIPVGELDVSLYRDDLMLKKNYIPKHKTLITYNLNQVHLILVDDVISSGRTMMAALNSLLDFGRPAVIEAAVLVDRYQREVPIQPCFFAKHLKVSMRKYLKMNWVEIEGEDSGIYLDC